MVKKSMDLLSWLRKQLEEADPDLLRAMVAAFVDALMGAEVDSSSIRRVQTSSRHLPSSKA